MLNRLIAFSIRRRGAIVALALLLTALSVASLFGARLDVFPEFAPVQVVVKTAAPGLSPRQTELLVTTPIEHAIGGVTDIANVRSVSVQGLSEVIATFKDGTDVLRARQLVAERLGQATSKIPRGAGPPEMAPLTTTTSTVLEVGLTSNRLSPMALRTFADFTVQPALLGVPGVAKVAIFGGDVRQLQIQPRPGRLAAFGLTVGDVVRAARKATAVEGAGFIDTPSQRIFVRPEGQSLTPAALGQIAVATHDGATIRLRDVAHVGFGAAPSLGTAAIAGQPGVVLIVASQLGANTLALTHRLESALSDLLPAMRAQGITYHPALFRPATFVETAISNLETSLLAGAVLIAAVLLAFLWSKRTAFISMVAIPLSLLAALAVLVRAGATLNTMTLGGLAIAIGEVVDDAIIDVENVHRRLQENRLLGHPRPAFRVILDASLEVRSAVVFATFVVILVFVPVLLMTGVQGRIFAPLGQAYILAVLASLIVALTVTPALCSLLLTRPSRDIESPILVWLRGRYARLLERVMSHPRLVVTGAVVFVLFGLATFPFLGGSFLPELHEGQFLVHMTAMPGTSLAESLRLGKAVERVIARDPDVRSVCQIVGTTQDADDIMGTQDSEFHVVLRPLPGRAAGPAEDRLKSLLVGFPGVKLAMNSFLTERLDETMSGQTAPVAIEVYGNSLSGIDRAAAAVARVLSAVPHARDVKVATLPGVPQLGLRLRPERLAEFGLMPKDVLDTIATIYRGRRVGQTYRGNVTTDVVVIGSPAERRDPQSAARLLLQDAQGTRIPLGTVAQLEMTSGRYAVLHDGGRREQTVTAQVAGGNVTGFVAAARKAIAAHVALPRGTYLHFSGAAEARAQAQHQLLVSSMLAGAGILLLLSVAVGNLRNLLLIVANLPFALVGGVLAAWLSGGDLSVGSLVGFVTLFGITTRNTLILVSRYEHLVEDGAPWGPQTAIQGATERLAPILMTALVTGLGLLPIALGSGTPGREVEGPMAIVILGGLVTSVALNLLVLPTLAVGLAKFGGQAEARAAALALGS